MTDLMDKSKVMQITSMWNTLVILTYPFSHISSNFIYSSLTFILVSFDQFGILNANVNSVGLSTITFIVNLSLKDSYLFVLS